MAKIWRHKKRGTSYEVLTYSAYIQFSSCREDEAKYGDTAFTVYQCLSGDCGVYVRPTSEFMDGRFERIADSNARCDEA